MNQLNRAAPIPLYYQLKEIIRQAIEEGELKPGSPIMTEEELQARYEVSRTTVRQAIGALVAEGFVRRERGRGTFVSEPKHREVLPRLMSFSEEMTAAGVRHGTRVLEARLAAPPKAIAARLNLGPDEQTLVVKRIRLVDDQPLSIMVSHIPASLGVNPAEDFSGSLYRLLEEKYGIMITEAEQQIGAVAADAYAAKVLNVKEGYPLLYIDRVTFSGDRPIEHVRCLYRADRYEYSTRLRRDRNRG
ncbi:MAG: GntR family transcriptional regulator [Bacillota bacterium]|nr:GntR family transcriptional regulator [Bacillota bacterium]